MVTVDSMLGSLLYRFLLANSVHGRHPSKPTRPALRVSCPERFRGGCNLSIAPLSAALRCLPRGCAAWRLAYPIAACSLFAMRLSSGAGGGREVARIQKKPRHGSVC